MTVVPNAIPETMPETEPTVAIAVLLLCQVPPGVALLRAIVAPIHTADGPEMAGGNGKTVTVATARQPVLSV